METPVDYVCKCLGRLSIGSGLHGVYGMAAGAGGGSVVDVLDLTAGVVGLDVGGGTSLVIGVSPMAYNLY